MTREITSLTNPLVKHLVKLRLDKKYRSEKGFFVLSGKKVVNEVCRQRNVESILFCDLALLPSGVSSENSYFVTPEIMKKVTGLDNPEGIIAEVALPQPSDLKNSRFLLVVEALSDPGNMGTLLRTALALGWDGCFLLPGCVDLFNEKVVRAAKGAHFHLPFCFGDWNDLLLLTKEKELPLVVGDLEGAAPESIPSQKGVALVMSNESRGPSESCLKAAIPTSLPMEKEVESLNVAIAGAILMYLLKGTSHA